VERILPLQKKAKVHTELLNLKNIHYSYSDGSWGWEEYAPFDGILVAAAPREIPEALLQQLAIDGVLIIPVGEQGGDQTLQRITRTESGFYAEDFDPVIFVPFLAGKE
jgi:protein-L-isoaspartate(D-aspartate) O-methyltransferase